MIFKHYSHIKHIVVNQMNIRENVLNSKKKSVFMDPYFMNIHDVKPIHFRDARIYDPEIKGDGWRISARSAQKKYRNWLGRVRSRDGYYLFRRIIYEPRDITLNDNDSIVFRNNNENHMKYIIKNTTPNSNKNITEGVNADDNDFIPKMFTERMGREISAMRNQNKMTQNELAQMINVDSSIIRNIELGGLVYFNPNDPMVKSLERVLGIQSIKYCE